MEWYTLLDWPLPIHLKLHQGRQPMVKRYSIRKSYDDQNVYNSFPHMRIFLHKASTLVCGGINQSECTLIILSVVKGKRIYGLGHLQNMIKCKERSWSSLPQNGWSGHFSESSTCVWFIMERYGLPEMHAVCFLYFFPDNNLQSMAAHPSGYIGLIKAEFCK